MQNEKVAPGPSALGVAERRPWWDSTMDRLTERPIPIPSALVVKKASERAADVPRADDPDSHRASPVLDVGHSCSANTCASVRPYGKKASRSPRSHAARCSVPLMSQSGRQRFSTSRRSMRSSSTVGRPKNQ